MLKYKKRLVYVVFAFFVGLFCFFGIGGIGVQNEVFAADSNTASNNDVFQEKATEWYERLSFMQKCMYVLVYPLIVVAGKLIDNSLVYGEVFGFDVVLWRLWLILRNLANFALGFLLVYKIFEFALKKQKSGDLKKLLISGLIAGVGIQASWFVMAAMIDISTVLAYGVGGLPITILKDSFGGTTDEDLKFNPYILKHIWYKDLEDPDTARWYLTNTQVGDVEPGNFYISECETLSYKDGALSEQLILAPKMIYYIEKKGNKEKTNKTEKIKCHLGGGEVYYFSSLYGSLESKFVSCGSEEDCRKAQNDYESALREAKEAIIGMSRSNVESLISSAKLLQIGDAHHKGGVAGFLGPIVYSSGQKGLDLYNKWTGEGGKTARLQDVLNENSYVGVFTALYSYLLNSGRGVISEDAGIYSALLNVSLTLAYLVAVAIPLIAAALVFMMRIGVLWMAIILLPFVILLKAFDLEKKVFKDKPLEYLKVENLIPIIFAPAIICFAVSMSTILVVIIYGLNVESIETVKTEILGGLIKLDIGGLSIGFGKLIISAFGVAITWFMLWAAIQATKLGETKLITGLKSLATNALGSVPIIPIPGKDGNGVEFIGANAAFGLNGHEGIFSTITNKMKRDFESEDQKAVDQRLNSSAAEEEANTNRATSYADKLVSLSASELGDDWRLKEIVIGEGSNQQSVTFNSLGDAGKEDVIKKINSIGDSSTRARFNVGDIEIGEGDDKRVYKFDTTNNVYK